MTGWEDLLTKLREFFLPLNYELSLREEIRLQTQGKGERVIVYFAAMTNVFQRLSRLPDKAERLETIR